MRGGNLNKKILSIDNDDDQKEYNYFKDYLEKDTNRKKNTTAKLIHDMGDHFLDEIMKKKEEHEIEKKILSEYIVNKSKSYLCFDKLMTYDIWEIRRIYDQVKYENRNILLKIIEYFIPHHRK